MPTKKFKPVTPSLRHRQVLICNFLSKKSPLKSLTLPLKSKGGRNNSGKITVRHKGGGVKRVFRSIDFLRLKDGVKARVVSLEYDPNRSANIALISYRDGEYAYILAPFGLKIGDFVENGSEAEVKIGNSLPLSCIPVGTTIHNLEISLNSGSKLVRSAGAFATVLGKNEKYATVRLPSGEIRLVHVRCRATIGQVGNLDFRNQVLGKAGASRWRGKRSAVRGSVMNPCDHPHGGGEGKSPVGRSSPMTPWGKPAFGKKTRKKRKSSKFILTGRKR